MEHDAIVTFISVLGNNRVCKKSLCLKGQFDKSRSRTICDLRICLHLTGIDFPFANFPVENIHRKCKSLDESQLISNYFCSKATQISWRSCNVGTSQNPSSRQSSHWIINPKIHHSLTSKSMEMISHGSQMSIMHDNRSQPEGLWLEK